jgi:hypothetical protein
MHFWLLRLGDDSGKMLAGRWLPNPARREEQGLEQY